VITRKPEHLKTFDYLGPHRYFLTFCTFERRHIFLTRQRTEAVHEQFLRASVDEAFAVLAYCFMPDHVHLLVEREATDSDCRRFIARAKQLSAFHFQKMFGLRLWQRYGFERTLRSNDATLSVARYILENPIRARLVERVQDYPFLGSSVYSLNEIVDAVQLHADWHCRSG
jgi:putative transposase